VNNEELVKKAETIANLINETDTDDRGILLSHVATMLHRYSQHYTANIFYVAAVDCGLAKNA